MTTRLMPRLPVLSGLLALILIRLVEAQANFGSTCAGGTVPDVAALASQYPPVGAVASIVPGDTVARALFNAISGAALSYTPTVMQGDNPVQTGYSGADPHCWWTYSGCVNSRVKGIPTDAYTCREPGTWGLTFDDGPTCVHAPLYSLLKQNNQQATLFYIGSNVATYPNEARLGVQNGHVVCVHTWSHHYSTSLTNEQIFAELYYAKKIIKDVTGYSTRCWRPPYGDVDDRVRTIAQALEMWTVIWDNDTYAGFHTLYCILFNSDSNDWEASSVGYTQPNADYAQILAGNYRSTGTLVLTHEVDTPAINLFLQHYAAIKTRMPHVVSATTCLNVTSPYAEANAPLNPNFAQVAANPQSQGLVLTPPAVAGSSGPVVFAGQRAFLASIQGSSTSNQSAVTTVSSAVLPRTSTTLVVVQPTSSVLRPSSASAAGASQSAALALVDVSKTNTKTNVGAIVGGVVGGIAGLALLVAFFLCARHRRWLCWRAKQPKKRQPIYLASPEMGYADGFPRSASQQALLNPHSPYMRSESSLGASRSQLDLRSPSPELPTAVSEHQVGVALGGDEASESLLPGSRSSSLSPRQSTYSTADLAMPAAAQHRESRRSVSHESIRAIAVSNDGIKGILAPGAVRESLAPTMPRGLL